MHARTLLLAAVAAAAAATLPAQTTPPAASAAAPTPPSAPAASTPEPAASSGPGAGEHSIYVEDIDRSADACTDFFQFANGAWRAKNPIPASMSRWSRRWAAGEQNKDQLRVLLNELAAKKDWPRNGVDQQITDFYRACLDQDHINAIGMHPIEPLLTQIQKIANAGDLQRTLSDLHGMAIFPLFGLTSTPDNHDPSQVIARVFPAGLGLPDRDYYLKTEPRFVEARAKYRAHVAKMFELSGSTPAVAKKAADTVFNLEKTLAAARLDNVKLRDPAATDHKMTVAALQKSTPAFNWTRYLQSLQVSVKDLNVDQPAYMKVMQKELASLPLATWKTYLTWNVINNAASDLTSKLVDEDFAFNGAYLAGQKEIKPRWKRCIETEDQLIGEALGQRYVERYFPPTAKARMQDLVKNLLAAMGDTIRSVDWMGADSKQHALAKLANFNVKVGYPDEWKDYSGISIQPTTHWQNVVAGRRFVTRDDLDQIGKPIDRGRWGMTPPTSDAYENPQLVEIVFPAGILQPPAFDVNAVDAYNYGAIGVVIGHEISHAFDDEGAQYDEKGRLHDWWTPEDYKRFQARTQCVADQFESYFIEPNIHHQGKLVLGESVGDLAGAKLAWLAFQKAQQERPAPTIDGFTPAQQFFLAWGQFRGDETRPEQQRLMVQGDPHPVAKYRVIGPLSNLPAFAEAWGCKAGDAMVRPPDKRCEVW